MNSVEEASHESGEDNSANVAGQSGSTEEEIRLQNENEEITQISSGSEESMENREEDEPKSDYSEELNEKLEEVKTNLDHESDQLKDNISEEESSEDKIIKEIENESNEEEGESTPEVEAITTYGEIDPKTESEERKIAEESSAEQEIQSNFKKESEERKIVEELSVEQKIQTNTKKESEEIVTNESFKEEGSLKGETQSQEEERPTEGASAEENRHDEGISRETEASTMGGMSKEIKREAEEDEKDKEAGRDAYEEEQDKVEEEKEFKVEEGEKMEEKEKQAMVEGAASENKVILKEMEPEEEDLTMSSEIPDKLRLRDHISEILKLDDESVEIENLMRKTVDTILKELKKLYETAIKPLEILYKYRDLSNRHFGDSEIFSKPLILFMGPWSGGKSTIINYLLNNEFKKTALRTGAEPSPAYFNIVMWGEREEVLDGTQLAADWTFSGLQKFGQGLLDRLKGHKLNHPLLAKVNIVEIPGILEIRKQVERMFPFNDACQWFIDRADIIFLVYDPSKLDVGPETEAILDQLKGREYQTRIILNKADQVKPEELMRVQGTLIWNISPLMSSTEPPVMYSTSLWSVPYQSGSPTRLLYAQEKAFLKDLKEAIDKRVENKIASARRFAVRVRNHAKMVDCYLTTYYNHKTFFGNKKKVSDDIIEHPQNYHIYEGLSTLTNISRYDLPDPDVYKDFFRLNPVYDFQQLSSTCTYFRGCPINRLDVAIAYDLPELVGKYKTSAEEVLEAAIKKNPENS
ncbi:hypothetical protein AAG570_013176 [Ranatra chinensis]|uniref:Dynamin-type G domain-containing protein n=1 Tax=Ranatra chinensis TaxID=642074 RepID=A0ABD0Z293_9HEMI